MILTTAIATEPICWSEFQDGTIVGEDPLNDGGRSVAYSRDEKYVAIASPVGDGTVRVYARDKYSGAFTQVGTSIENDTGDGGDKTEEETYARVQRTEALVSSDGSVVAVASRVLSEVDAGGLVVRVFGYDDLSDSWIRRGEDIVRTYYETMAMSSDGNVLTFGSKTGFGFPLMYYYDGGSWSNVEFHADCLTIDLMRDLSQGEV